MLRRIVPIFLLLVVAGNPLEAALAQSGGKTPPSHKAADPGQIEDVQEVTPVETAAPPSGAGLLGRMHPALVHFPIGWVFLLLIVETAALITRRDELAKPGFLLLVLACLSFIPAATTGFLRASSIGNDPEFRALMVPHRNMNIAAAVLCLAALVLRIWGKKRSGAPARWPYLLLLAGACALLLVAGHLGGKMVFGANYLPF